MSTSTTKKPGSTGSSDPEVTRIVNLTELSKKVDELAGKVTGGAGASGNDSRETSAPAGSGSVEDQVSRAVAAAREQDAARTAEEKRRKELDERIKSLEERTEKRPAERSRLTKWMWGTDD